MACALVGFREKQVLLQLLQLMKVLLHSKDSCVGEEDQECCDLFPMHWDG